MINKVCVNTNLDKVMLWLVMVVHSEDIWESADGSGDGSE